MVNIAKSSVKFTNLDQEQLYSITFRNFCRGSRPWGALRPLRTTYLPTSSEAYLKVRQHCSRLSFGFRSHSTNATPALRYVRRYLVKFYWALTVRGGIAENEKVVRQSAESKPCCRRFSL